MPHRTLASGWRWPASKGAAAAGAASVQLSGTQGVWLQFFRHIFSVKVGIGNVDFKAP